MSFSRKIRVNKILLARAVSDLIENSPVLYNAVMRCKLGSRMSPQRVVTKSTKIIIEGYPRSANSFAVRAFRYANDGTSFMPIATHLHSPASVRLGILKNIPTLVLIRNPKDCIISWLALAFQLNKLSQQLIDTPELQRLFCYWTKRYVVFYKALYPFKEQFVTASYEQVITNFGECIKTINQHYTKQFNLFDHSEENVRSIFETSKVHLSPSVERDVIKEKLLSNYHHQTNAKNIEDALSIYKKFL